MMGAVGLLAIAGCGPDAPNSASVHWRIGPEGGVMSSYDSVLTITLLPGALDRTIDFFIEPTGIPPEVYGPAYRIDPNPTLLRDATITYRFELPEERAALVAVDPLEYAQGEARWKLIPRIDVDDKLVKGRDSQISVFYALLDDGPLIDDEDGTGTTGGGPGPGPGPGSSPDDDGDDDDDDDNGVAEDPMDDNTDMDDMDDEGIELPCPVDLGPFVPEAFIDLPGEGAEDLSFSPNGDVFAAVSAERLAYVNPAGEVMEDVSELINVTNGVTTGTRFDANGDIYVAGYFADQILLIDGVDGTVGLISDDGLIDAPNQIVVDVMGNVWLTSSDASAVQILDPTDGTVRNFVQGGGAVGFANGLVVDWNREMVFWSDYNGGVIGRAQFDPADLTLVGDPVDIADVPGNPDGMTMDSCGYLYTMDEGNQGANPSRLIRVFTDEAGDQIGETEVVADFPVSRLSNVQFAQGADWEAAGYDTSVFVVGIPGEVFRVELGVTGGPTVAGP